MTWVLAPGTVKLPEILPANVPTKYPAVVMFPVALTIPAVNKFPLVVFPVTLNDVNVPTEVIFG